MQEYQENLKRPEWSHIRVGSWVGGVSGMSRQVLEGANIPTVHLLKAGSNTCISGFRDPAEAREFRSSSRLSSDWCLVDLRDDRPRHTRSKLEAARREKIESIFEDHVFPSDVEDVSGWEYDGEDRFQRPVFLQDPEGDSRQVTFSVTFRERTSEDWVAETHDVETPEEDMIFDASY